MGRAHNVAERRSRALELHLAGVTYERIAQALGYASRSGAHQAVRRALGADSDGVVEEEEILTQLAACNAMQQGLWAAARGGDTRAVDAVLRLMERRLDLLGMLARRQPDLTREQGEGEPSALVDFMQRMRERAARAEERPRPS